MNSKHSLSPATTAGVSRQSRTRSKWLPWLIPLVGVPLLGLAAFIGWVSYSESRASQQLELLIEPIRAAGEPLGDAFMEQRFRQTAATEGTAAWSRILMLSSSFGGSEVSDLPILGQGEQLRLLDPDVPWADNDRVGSFLTEARPILDLIHAAAVFPTPVWQPMVFGGIGTLLSELQDSRQVSRLVQLDFEHAIMNRDSERALRALESMRTVVATFDWDMYLVGELVNIALRSMHYQSIQRSLTADVWSVEQLELLKSQVREPVPIARMWRNGLQAEQAMVLAAVEQRAVAMPGLVWGSSARSKLAYFKKLQQLERLADAPMGRLSERASELESSWQRGGLRSLDEVLSQLYAPAATAFATALERAEHLRRLVLTSLAVKQFQLTHDRWPTALSELSEVGLTADDWTLPAVGSLGYAIGENHSDSTAYVWSLSNEQTRVAATPPDFAEEKLEKVSYYLTIIR